MNMSNHIEDIMQRAQRETLRNSEREVLHARVNSFMREHPFPQTSPTISPYYSWFLLVRSHVAISAVAILVFVSGTGSLFAEGSLPGDLLYRVKTDVNEKVLGWFANSPDTRAEWQLSLADRRLSESEILAKEDRLSPEVRIKLQGQFTENTNSAFGVDGNNMFATGMSQPEISPVNVSLEDSKTEKEAVSRTMMIATTEAGDVSTTTSTTTKQEKAPRTVTRDQIMMVRKNIDTLKKHFEKDRRVLVKQGLFIQVKGSILLAQKILFDSEEALKIGNIEEAETLFLQAQSLVQKTTVMSEEAKPTFDGEVSTPSVKGQETNEPNTKEQIPIEKDIPTKTEDDQTSRETLKESGFIKTPSF